MRIQVCSDEQRGKPLADGHGLIHRTRRHFVEHQHTAGDAFELGDQIGDAFRRRLLPFGRQQLAAGGQVTLAQLGDIGLKAGLVSGFGAAQRVEQQVRDFGHGRNYNGHRPARLLFRGDARGDTHTFGRAYAGAAEFHYEQIVQLKSFPLVNRARTTFKISSSTPSSESPVESM